MSSEPSAEPAEPAEPTHPAELRPPGSTTTTGSTVVWLDLVATAVFVITAAIGAVVTTGPLRVVAAAVALGWFVLGCVAFLWALWLAAQRSREAEMGIGGLFLLLGEVAPTRVRLALDGALGVQVAVGLVTASLRSNERPFTTLAFGLLVPVLGLGLNGLWGARHGHFGPRLAAADGGSGSNEFQHRVPR